MTSDREWPQEWQDLADAVIDGRATPAEFERLEVVLTTNEAARIWYVDYVHQHAALTVTANEADWPAGAPLPAIAPRPHYGRWTGWAVGLIAMAAAVVAAVWTVRQKAPADVPAPVATLTAVKGCRWLGGSLPTEPGAALPPGRLRLDAGMAQLTFVGGAEVTLEGPCDVELTGPDRCTVFRGRLVARVNGQAGFVVDTPPAVLRDLGTEFGVHVRDETTADVEVFTGAVDVQARSSGAIRRVLEGAAVRVGCHGIVEVGADAEAPPPSAADRRATVTISTSAGRGRDGFVASGPEPGADTPHLLMVKRLLPDEEPFQRKVYLKFDLASAAAGRVVEAKLRLTLVPGDHGFASVFPDATFAVYGLTDEALDDWDDTALRWETAPANRPGGAALDPAKVIRVGEFVVERGVTQGTITIESPTLADFLNRDTNRLATLIVVRETGSAIRKSVIHCFAGRLHPTAPPPSLELTVAPRRP